MARSDQWEAGAGGGASSRQRFPMVQANRSIAGLKPAVWVRTRYQQNPS